ncbi:MAG: FAD:protein FMN transferase [Clostridia bacterium]|nr:FAD:protein FMN transferase [Clostridia bacterium]
MKVNSVFSKPQRIHPLFYIRIVLLLLTGILLLSCSASENSKSPALSKKPIQAETDVFAMDTFITLKAYGPDADTLLESAKDRIAALEKLLSVTDSDSDIWKLNHANGQSTTVGEDTAAIIRGAIEISTLTDGALDISVYPLVSAWGFTTGSYQIPTEDTIQSLLPYVNYKKIVLDALCVTLPYGMQIDLGAAAKGYTGDVIAALLREGGISSAMLNLGGNVHTIGTKQDGSPWKIAIANPFTPQTNLLTLDITNEVVITSGNYERYFTDENGKRYCHIIDSKTGYPADHGIVSMTIVGDNGLTCDALSTALYVMGAEKAIEVWQETGGFEMIFVTEDKTIYLTEGLSDRYTNISNLPLIILS